MIDTLSSPAESSAATTATIASGASLSAVLPAPAMHLIGVQMPAAWDAAVLTFAGSVDGTNFFRVDDVNGTELTIQATASRYISVSPTLLGRVPYLKVRSGTNASAVNQTADRALLLFFARYT